MEAWQGQNKMKNSNLFMLGQLSRSKDGCAPFIMNGGPSVLLFPLGCSAEKRLLPLLNPASM